MPLRPLPSTAALAAILDLLPVATLILDLAGLRVLGGNAEAAALIGCRPAALRGAWDALLEGTPAGAKLRERLAAVTSQEAPEVFDASLEPPDVPARAVLIRARCVEIEGQACLSAALVDITRRQEAEARLATAHRRLEVALAGAELGAWQRDLRTDILDVSPRWCEMIGLPPMRRVPVAVWKQLVHPEDQAKLRRLTEDHLAGRHDRFEMEVRLRHADGRWIPVLSRGEVIERDAGGRPQVITGTHYDLSARREAEAALARSEWEARRRLAELETLYRTAPLGLGQLDRSLRFVRINEALADMNGFPAEAHVGRSAWDLVPDLRAAAEPLMRQVVERGEPITDIEVSGETPKAPGLRRDWIEQFYPVCDPETGEVTGLGVVCEEVTERKRAERTRELLVRELDHRVKNLFAVVSGLVSFSARGAATPQGMRETLLGRIGALARAHDLVRHAIEGHDRRPFRATTLPGLLRALLAPFQGGDLPEERLLLRGEPVPIGPITAPPLALAVHELATNAARYGALSREGGRVAIDWAAEREVLQLRWAESGGPRVVRPHMVGFGHRLAVQSAMQIGGSADFAWEPGGLVVTLDLPLERLAL
ncbi:sensor histidine kinase [Roseicella aquatilis]|uniref:histidine kinase n=1 Tax=Roseicella aquatilis TaxID=2527868 RepID=A0A4R4DL24_9PROT|nr:PAS domain-containing protein [Roseicella aquatilis]TCZ61257.1 PAS domain S-box protein [Roseicella aquatilis]